jgi:citrate lyase subunit beta/citryl-CoA lyase
VSARSWLFVPGDSDRKLARIEQCGADVVILDLEDSVAPAQKSAARARVYEFLRVYATRSAAMQRPDVAARPQLWVRINPLSSTLAEDDLHAVAPAAPAGIVQPKTRSPADAVALAYRLDELEHGYGLRPGSIRILPIATETPAALFAIGDYAQVGARLAGLTWGAEDLSTVIGATATRGSDRAWTSPFEFVRSLCLFGAGAAGVAAVDTLCADFRDRDGLRASCERARRDGFTGKLAIHPDQVPTINECFAPTADELARAQRIVELFAANPDAAALSLDGQMVDIPHLRLAEKTLARGAALAR